MIEHIEITKEGDSYEGVCHIVDAAILSVALLDAEAAIRAEFQKNHRAFDSDDVVLLTGVEEKQLNSYQFKFRIFKDTASIEDGRETATSRNQ